jgi:hypothetical protein
MGIEIEWDGSAGTRIKLLNMDKSDFVKRFDTILEYPPELFGGQRAAGAQVSNTDRVSEHTWQSGISDAASLAVRPGGSPTEPKTYSI